MSPRSRFATLLSSVAAGAVVVVVGLGAVLTSQLGAVSGTPTKAVAAMNVPRPELALAPPSAADPTAIYVPITPCRIVNTMLIAGGRFANNTAHGYVVAGTAITAQGGASGGCGIPTAATAITANLTANNPVGNGYLRGWPTGGSEPSGGLLTYPDGIGVTSGATIAIKPGGGTALTVRNHTGATDLVIDATGYYVQQIYATIAGNGTIVAASNRIVVVTKLSGPIYQITVDRTTANCVATASAWGGTDWYTSTAVTANVIFVYLWDAAGNPKSGQFTVTATC